MLLLKCLYSRLILLPTGMRTVARGTCLPIAGSPPTHPGAVSSKTKKSQRWPDNPTCVSRDWQWEEVSLPRSPHPLFPWAGLGRVFAPGELPTPAVLSQCTASSSLARGCYFETGEGTMHPTPSCLTPPLECMLQSWRFPPSKGTFFPYSWVGFLHWKGSSWTQTSDFAGTCSTGLQDFSQVGKQIEGQDIATLMPLMPPSFFQPSFHPCSFPLFPPCSSHSSPPSPCADLLVPGAMEGLLVGHQRK